MVSPVPPPSRDPLLMSAAALCRRVDPIEESTSIKRAAQEFIDVEIHVLPVVHNGMFVGMLSEFEIIRALSVGMDVFAPVSTLVDRSPEVIYPRATGAEALRMFEASQADAIAVVDDHGGVFGILTPARLMNPPTELHRPKTVGGMATPLGVYLTNGTIGAGVSMWGLFLTGAVMFGLFLVGGLVMTAVAHWVGPPTANQPWFAAVMEIGALIIFLLGLRLLPLAGIHGAEHMVVHAIERGEELTPEVVSRMPRVHPRCGTNLAVGAMIFLGIMSFTWIPDMELRLLLGALVTLVAWRPLGSALQFFVTTKQPTQKQILAGIESGKDLLNKVQDSSNLNPTVFQRILSSGIFQIMLGSLALNLVVYLLMLLFNVPKEWQIFVN